MTLSFESLAVHQKVYVFRNNYNTRKKMVLQKKRGPLLKVVQKKKNEISSILVWHFISISFFILQLGIISNGLFQVKKIKDVQLETA